jgi:ferredoxin-thioredoxin reductase catalytic chain
MCCLAARAKRGDAFERSDGVHVGGMGEGGHGHAWILRGACSRRNEQPRPQHRKLAGPACRPPDTRETRMEQPRQESIDKMWRYAEKFAEKSGTHLHPDRFITEGVILGLAANIDKYGRPICPCNFYPEKDENGNWPEGLYLPKEEEAKRRTWICACDEMQIYKYCHCLLFVTEEGLPITEYLPEDHEGREIYGLVKDPTPDKGRALGRVMEKQQQQHTADES